jgi:glycosyltransferase involved in cell wall biosynthesis
MIRLFILIRSLEVGGAERQLVELVKAMDKTRFSITVATFYDGGGFRPELEKLNGVCLISLHKEGRWDVVAFGLRLLRTVRRTRPHVIMGSMGVANELALLAGRATGARVAWGLRASSVDFSQYHRISRWIFLLGRLLSRFPDLIIVNSHEGKRHHLAHGYRGKRMIVIPNGVDIDRFKPDDEAGVGLRQEWNVEPSELLIGLVGRLDPMKDHPTFLRSAAVLAARRSAVRFVCVGDGVASYKQELVRLAASLGLADRLVWAGHRSDMAAVYNAFDIVCSSSYGEGTSNVIAEAMACGIACVATDVGDSGRLVGRVEFVVPPRDPAALSAALERLVDMPDGERAELGRQARQRMITHYSVQRMAKSTEEALVRISRCAG